MRLSRRVSVVVGVVLAACGGATEGVPGTSGGTSGTSGTSGSSGSSGSSGGSSGSSGSSGTSGATNECPHTETLKSFPKTLTRDELCAVESDKKFQMQGFSAAVGIEASRCAALCGDALINTCEIPFDKQAEYRAIYAYGTEPDAGPDAGTCPFADKVSPLAITCKQNVVKGTQASGCPVEGRRFEGYAPAATCSADANAVARYFASCAHLEAASVVAFERLAGELAFHDAPHDLIEACRAAAREETQHAASVGALAHRFGAQPAPLEAEAAHASRAVLEIAIENAVEGMVRELFGAAQAHWRAARATDVTVRETMGRIADDESRHAELSSRIGEFLASRLDATSLEQVRLASEAARGDLRRELACSEVDPALVAIAGVPTRASALMLFDALERDIWLAA